MISTGLQKLDKFLDGGIPEGLIVDIFGKNGTGKTQLLLQLTFNSVKNGGHVLYFDTTGGFRPERILEIQEQSKTNQNFLNSITISRIRNTSEQLKSIENLSTKNYSLIVIDNITDLFSYEYKKPESIFEKNFLFMKYMHNLSLLATKNKIPIVITNMVRNIEGKEIENMNTAINQFTHIKIHLFKKSSKFSGIVFSPFKKKSFSYEIHASGISNCSEDI